jgi:hypothetical protein
LKYWYVVLLAVIGLAGGYLYWRFIGCKTGSCPITSNWYSSAFVGGIIGYLAGDMFTDISKRKNINKTDSPDQAG